MINLHVSFNNKLIEDFMIVIAQRENVSDKYTCSDKIHRYYTSNKNETFLPLIFQYGNIYEIYQKEIFHYYNNISKYNAIGITNIDQYLSLLQLKSGKLYGKNKKEAIILRKYLENRKELTKEGFLTAGEYLEFKLLNSNNISLYYSIKKDYEENKDYLALFGIYSLQDYCIYNEMTNKSLIAYYCSGLQYKIPLDHFLNFELREFIWKKSYKSKIGSLDGVQKELKRLYSTRIKYSIDASVHQYFIEPEYYYVLFGIKNFGEFYEFKCNTQNKK